MLRCFSFRANERRRPEKKPIFNHTADARKMNENSKRFRFTLVEMLVVISILSILTTLIFPVVNQARGKAKSTLCINHLKQSLTMVQMYGTDHNEIPVKYWSKALLADGYITESNWEALICPDWEPRKELGNHHQMYGICQLLENVHLLTGIDNPSTHVLLADSIRLNPSDPRDGMKQYFMFYGTAGQYMNRVHCRHQRKANIGFLDGHVQGLAGRDLERVGCPKYCYCPDVCDQHAPLY